MFAIGQLRFKHLQSCCKRTWIFILLTRTSVHQSWNKMNFSFIILNYVIKKQKSLIKWQYFIYKDPSKKPDSSSSRKFWRANVIRWGSSAAPESIIYLHTGALRNMRVSAIITYFQFPNGTPSLPYFILKRTWARKTTSLLVPYVFWWRDNAFRINGIMCAAPSL